MRLRDYQKLLEDSIISIKQLSTTIVKNNTNLGRVNDVKVTGLVSFNDAISKLEDAKLFSELLRQIRSLEYFNRVENELVVQENEYNNLNNYRQQLLSQIKNLKNTIDNILSKEDENTINLKIPNNISTISELKDFVSNLDLVLHIYKEFSCDVSFSGVETGSAWIAIVIGIGAAAKPCIEFLFKIAEKSLELRNLKLEGDRKVLEIEELKGKISAQEFKIVSKARKEKNDEEYDKIKIKFAKEALKVLKTLKDNITNENEVIEKTKISLEKLGELIDEGIEIRPALNAPEEVKQISEQFNISLEEHKKILIGINSQKLIEQKDKTEDNTNKIEENQEENIDEQK